MVEFANKNAITMPATPEKDRVRGKHLVGAFVGAWRRTLNVGEQDVFFQIHVEVGFELHILLMLPPRNVDDTLHLM